MRTRTVFKARPGRGRAAVMSAGSLTSMTLVSRRCRSKARPPAELRTDGRARGTDLGGHEACGLSDRLAKRVQEPDVEVVAGRLGRDIDEVRPRARNILGR